MDKSTDGKVSRWLARFQRAKAKKATWNNLWQFCGEYVHTKKIDFTEENYDGEFLTHNTFDSTAPKACRRMAYALLGLLWVGAKRSIRLEPVDKIKNLPGVKDYFDLITDKLTTSMDDPRAGLMLALEEYMIDQGAFGTSGIACFENPDPESDLIYSAWGVDEISIEEGRNGYVRTIYRDFEISLLQAAEDYGLENLSEASKEKFKNGERDCKIKFIHVISPREKVESGARGNMAMAFESLMIEYTAKHLVYERGFEEMPCAVARFFKRRREFYGRSPAMDALPDILQLNQMQQARVLAVEKILDPPLGVYDDSVLGNEEIDTSPGGLSVFASSGRVSNSNPIFPLFSVGDIGPVDKDIDRLIASINEHFNIDRLLDFNNETQMTLGEANLRNRIRSESLATLFGRQIAETFTPLVERSFNIMWRSGSFGVIRGSEKETIEIMSGNIPEIIPDAVVELILSGEEFYKIEYMTPAARMMQSIESDGVLRAWEFAGLVGQASPEVFDVLDADESLKVIGYSAGAPSRIYRSPELIENIRAQRAQAQANAQAQMSVAQDAAAMQQIGQAGQALAQADNTMLESIGSETLPV